LFHETNQSSLVGLARLALETQDQILWFLKLVSFWPRLNRNPPTLPPFVTDQQQIANRNLDVVIQLFSSLQQLASWQFSSLHPIAACMQKHHTNSDFPLFFFKHDLAAD